MNFDGDPLYLFQEVAFGGPLEELRASFEKKFRTHLNLGETEQAARLERAYELARKALETQLSSPVSAPRESCLKVTASSSANGSGAGGDTILEPCPDDSQIAADPSGPGSCDSPGESRTDAAESGSESTPSDPTGAEVRS